MTRKALGRGLSALITEPETQTIGLEYIPIDLIDPNPLQPRRRFDEATLRELADSIQSSGVVQPVLVRRVADRYQLVAGERRFRAAAVAGLKTVPSVVRDLTDAETLELALTENLLREDLNAIEVAEAYKALQERFALNQDDIAKRLGLSRTTVTNTLRLLKLPQEIQQMLADGQLSPGHARALLSIESPELQLRLAGKIISRGMSVRQIEALAGGREKPDKSQQNTTSKLDPNIGAAVISLERRLGTKVRIVGSNNRGRIEVQYFSSDDLTRIFDAIMK